MNLDRLTDLTAPAQLGDLVCAFAAPLLPLSKERPRVERGRARTPQRTRDYEAAVALFAGKAMRGKPPTKAPVRVIALLEQVDRRPRDLDNQVKALLDGIAGNRTRTGPVLVNDAQVVEIRARVERGAPVNRITVLIEEMPNEL